MGNSPRTLVCAGLGPSRKAIKMRPSSLPHGARLVTCGESRDCLPPSGPNPTPQQGTLPVALPSKEQYQQSPGGTEVGGLIPPR